MSATGDAKVEEGGKVEEVVALIGSGNWGSAVAGIIGNNVPKLDGFRDTIQMWVYEEEVEGRKLTEIINTEHENVKYLPGHRLPDSIVANPSLEDTVKGATLLIMVLPHQFLPRLLPTVKAHMAPTARAISLIKGIDFEEGGGIQLVSDTIRDGLGCDVACLMGANVASEIAKGEFAEATIGCTVDSNARTWQSVFDCPRFRVTPVSDVTGVELCGALKNIVALGAGFCDGLGYGGNTKAAIMRMGLAEIMKFCRMLFDTVHRDTFFEACGFADLITTCYGGRNRKCAAAYAAADGSKSWGELEAELLGGQKLQGTLACKGAYGIIAARGVQDQFPLISMIYRIAFHGVSPSSITETPRAPHATAVTKTPVKEGTA